MQLCWYGHVTLMLHERTAEQPTDTLPSGKKPRKRRKFCCRDYAEDQAWTCLGIPSVELQLVAGDRDAWRFQLKLLPL